MKLKIITILLLALLGILILAQEVIAQPPVTQFERINSVEPIVFEEEIPPLLIAIKKAESGGNPKAQNPTSSAGGLFQFIDSSWKSYGQQLWGVDWVNKDKYNAEHNTELALYAFTKDGYYPWCMSMYSWTTDTSIHAKCIARYAKYGYVIPRHY